jgi:hypothetical protein
MTSDPNAPGVAAEYLEINESANDNMHDESYYARIKVLTEKGKELATVELPYLEASSRSIPSRDEPFMRTAQSSLCQSRQKTCSWPSPARRRLIRKSLRCQAWKWAAFWNTNTICATVTTLTPLHRGHNGFLH